MRGLLKQVALVLAIVVGVRLYQQRGAASGEAPEWPALRDVEGTPVDLSAYRGAPVLVHFWASWCGVCQAERHNLEAVADDVPVLAIASRSGPAPDVRNYLAEHSLGRARVVVDPSGALAQRYGVRAYPTKFFLDGQGQILHVEVGYTTELGLRLRMWLSGL